MQARVHSVYHIISSWQAVEGAFTASLRVLLSLVTCCPFPRYNMLPGAFWRRTETPCQPMSVGSSSTVSPPCSVCCSQASPSEHPSPAKAHLGKRLVCFTECVSHLAVPGRLWECCSLQWGCWHVQSCQNCSFPAMENQAGCIPFQRISHCSDAFPSSPRPVQGCL